MRLETCKEYFVRRIKEGWKCIKLDYPIATLLSPDGIIKRLNLQNDVETLRPNAAGFYTNLSRSGDTANYLCVDDVTPDEGTSFVYRDGEGTASDQYNLPAHSGSGTINSVTVYGRARKTKELGTIYLRLRTHSTNYQSSAIGVTTSYVTYSWQQTTNPNTGLAWTWDEIDALEIGESLNFTCSGPCGLPPLQTRCTQTYVEIDYTPAVSDVVTRSHGYIF